MSRPLSCIFVNVNSCVSLSKRHFLNIFIAENKPDVLLLAEHKLSSNHRLEVRGYSVFRYDRTDRGGGTAVLLKEGYRCDRVPINTGSIESCAVWLWRGNGTSITFVSLYLRPVVPLNIADLDPVLALCNVGEVVVGADLSAKHPLWGGSDIDTRGRILASCLLASPCFEPIAANSPTRPNGTSGTFIDLFLRTSGICLAPGSDLSETLDYESDHRAIRIQLLTGNMDVREVQGYLNFNRMNIRRFRGLLRNSLESCVLPTSRNV